MQMGGQHHALANLISRRSPDIYCTHDWIGLGAGVNSVGKILLPPGFEHRTVQPVI
jgi:hypothetical protein